LGPLQGAIIVALNYFVVVKFRLLCTPAVMAELSDFIAINFRSFGGQHIWECWVLFGFSRAGIIRILLESRLKKIGRSEK